MTLTGLRVALRLDADERIGHGHAVRSGALLSALTIGSLAVAGKGDALARHFPSAELHPPEAFAALCAEADLAIVDHPDPEHALARSGALRVVIDDAGDVASADVVVNGTGLAGRHAYPKLRPAALRLCGTAYTVLRTAFAATRPPGPRAGVAIAVGSGQRAADWLRRVLAKPLDLSAPGCVIVSPSFPDLAALADTAARQGLALHVGLSGEDLASLLASSSAALLTGGMIVPEALVAGSAAVVFPNEPDLVDEVAWLAQHQAVRALPPDGDGDDAREALCDLLHDAPRRAAQVRAARNIFDGLGAFRVAHAILGELDARRGPA